MHSREKQNLNRNRQPSMQCHHSKHQYPAGLRVCGAHHRPKVPHQKPAANRKTHAHKHPVQHRDGAPADQRHRNPDDVCIPVQRPALDQASARPGAEPAQQAPQGNRDEAGVAIHETCGTTQKAKIVHEMAFVVGGQVLRDGACDEKDEDNGGGEPEGAVEVRVAIKEIQEGRARIEGGFAAAENFGSVDVEELRVKGEGPEEAFGGGG